MIILNLIKDKIPIQIQMLLCLQGVNQTAHIFKPTRVATIHSINVSNSTNFGRRQIENIKTIILGETL